MLICVSDNLVLKDWGVWVQGRANVLVCTNHIDCHVGLLPNELVAHLKNQHQIKLSQSLVNSQLLPLGPRPSDIYQLEHPIAPFQGIHIYFGLVCKICSYACIKRDTTCKHFVNQHWGAG